MTHFINQALARMRADEPAIGLAIRLNRSGEIALLAKSLDYDFLFIDMQHSGISIQTALEISLTALAAGIAPLIRVAGVDNIDAPRLLDAGAMGIIFPSVNTAAEAQRAVDNCKFAPIGKRSVGGGYPHFSFATVPIGEAVKVLNHETAVVCMIETKEGLENLDAIAAVEGVDVIHLGANDLLADMGLHGQFDHPIVNEAVEAILAACRKHNKFAGLGGDKTPEGQSRFIRAGGRFMSTHSDYHFIAQGAGAHARKLREVSLG
ncbi:MAG: hpcH/HpaI aldolase/citrate lyase family protein [Devosia sp.]|nr:hpcH/HpaI aldolase/citrate lyase family protein [Devosia sp.]